MSPRLRVSASSRSFFVLKTLHESPRLFLLRVVENFLWRAGFDGVSALKVDHLIRDAPGKVHIVRNDHQRFSQIVQGPQHARDLLD